MKIYVTGPKGRLGSQLVALGCNPLEVDITNLYLLESTVNSIQPDVIINCAAFTDVDACETSDGNKKAIAVNLHGVENLRKAFHGRLIHLSTDYVFDGKHGPYNERTQTLKDNGPVNRYGYSKLGGEIALLNPIMENKTCIVRTTGLYGGPSSRPDFLKMVVETVKSGNTVYISRDLKGNQTYIPHLAKALLELVYLPVWPPILHIASREIISRYDFSLMIATVFGLNKNLLQPTKNATIPQWIATRPTEGGLRTRLAVKNGLPIYNIIDGLKEAVKA